MDFLLLLYVKQVQDRDVTLKDIRVRIIFFFGHKDQQDANQALNSILETNWS